MRTLGLISCPPRLVLVPKVSAVLQVDGGVTRHSLCPKHTLPANGMIQTRILALMDRPFFAEYSELLVRFADYHLPRARGPRYLSQSRAGGNYPVRPQTLKDNGVNGTVVGLRDHDPATQIHGTDVC